MTETDAPEVLARLSSAITAETGPAGYLQLWRESTTGQPSVITLRPRVEDALLDLLLARRDARQAAS